MYTKLDDERQAKFIKAYMDSHPDCSIKDIVQDCVVARSRLSFLQSQGYFSLPNINNRKEIMKQRFKSTIQNRNYVSVSAGREYGRWKGYSS